MNTRRTGRKWHANAMLNLPPLWPRAYNRPRTDELGTNKTRSFMQYQWQYQVQKRCHLWTLRRNCVLSPAQLAVWFVSISAVSLGIAASFAAFGAWLIVPFALLEVAVLGIAFFCYARHAGDYERIEVAPGRLRVEAGHGAHVRIEEVSPPWVRVDYRARSSNPIVLVAGRQSFAVGRFVPDHRKQALADELRGALSQG